jgi:hypothetical protein
MCSDQETTDLVIDGIPFGHKHSIDAATLTHTADTRKIAQGTVELGKLINGFISDKGLADKENFVGIIDGYQLGEGAHQRLGLMSPSEFQSLEECMHTSLSCMRPAVSIRTTSKSLSLAMDYISTPDPASGA